MKVVCICFKFVCGPDWMLPVGTFCCMPIWKPEQTKRHGLLDAPPMVQVQNGPDTSGVYKPI